MALNNYSNQGGRSSTLWWAGWWAGAHLFERSNIKSHSYTFELQQHDNSRTPGPHTHSHIPAFVIDATWTIRPNDQMHEFDHAHDAANTTFARACLFPVYAL